ncbi:MAG TPA: hypothetical protein VFJ51_12595 [Nitrososphaeraceae archaeon]|nr:hypothetical protein [Nitrososphaeraceae archaeon]
METSLSTDGAYWYNNEACKWLRLTQACYYVRNRSRISWRGLFISKSKIGLNVLMIIFPVKSTNVIDSTLTTG